MTEFGCATVTRRAAAAVAVEFVLVCACRAVAVDIVTQCRASVVEARLQRSADRLDESVCPIHGEPTGGRIDLGHPQCLVGVDVPDSRHGTLCEQDGLEVPVASFHERSEGPAREGRIPGLGTEMIERGERAVVAGVDNSDTAEPSGVVEGECPPVGEAPPGP